MSNTWPTQNAVVNLFNYGEVNGFADSNKSSGRAGNPPLDLTNKICAEIVKIDLNERSKSRDYKNFPASIFLKQNFSAQIPLR